MRGVERNFERYATPQLEQLHFLVLCYRHRLVDEPVLSEVVFTGAKNTRSFMCGALSEKGDAATELDFARELLGQVVTGLPRERLGLHVCRGNWTRDETAALAGDYRALLPVLEDWAGTRVRKYRA